MANLDSTKDIEEKESLSNINYKMVTFTLDNKDYGIDIMNIREIQKGNRFTQIPNAPSYVRGVYNLRGEIISVVDLRKFFALKNEISETIEAIEPPKDELTLKKEALELEIKQLEEAKNKLIPKVEEDIAVEKDVVVEDAELPLNKKFTIPKRNAAERERVRNERRRMQENLEKNLPSEEILIAHLGETTLGIIVDSIDKVVGVDAATIQKAHPLFNDINVGYIQGIVEKDSRLYIILNIDKIFGNEELELVSPPEEGNPVVTPVVEVKKPEPAVVKPVVIPEPEVAPKVVVEPVKVTVETGKINGEQLASQLLTQLSFYKNESNAQWFNNRIAEYAEEGVSLDINNQTELEEFMTTFYSRYHQELWDEDLIQEFSDLLKDKEIPLMQLWDIGCGKGHEAYSLALIVSQLHEDQKVKVYAQDNDFLSVTMAPSLSFQYDDVPTSFQPFLTESGQFNNDIKNTIVFEFHDVINPHKFPFLNVVVMRDLLSFVNNEVKTTLLANINGIVEVGTLLVIGDNEELNEIEWKKITNTTLSVYEKI